MKSISRVRLVPSLLFRLILAAAAVPAAPAVAGDEKAPATSSATTAADASASGPSGEMEPGEVRTVKTTAYTHTEADHVKYANKNAIGTPLRYGNTRSAAADWSQFPVGTKFRIEGRPETYEIDDYGSALVGKEVIDLYKPSEKGMNTWGARHVEIEIVEWGDFEKSLEILKPRAKYASSVRKMIRGIEEKIDGEDA